jgi:hypothetical protein
LLDLQTLPAACRRASSIALCERDPRKIDKHASNTAAVAYISVERETFFEKLRSGLVILLLQRCQPLIWFLCKARSTALHCLKLETRSEALTLPEKVLYIHWHIRACRFSFHADSGYQSQNQHSAQIITFGFVMPKIVRRYHR